MNAKSFSYLSCALVLLGLFLGYPLHAEDAGVAAPVGFVRFWVPSHDKVLVSSPFDPFDSALSAVLGSFLSAGESQETADQVMIWDPRLQRYSTAWKSPVSAAGQSLWVDDAQGGASKQVVVPGLGFWVVNNHPEQQSLYLRGRVILDDFRLLKMESAYNLIASPFTFGTPFALSNAKFDASTLASADEIRDEFGNRAIRLVQGSNGGEIVAGEEGSSPLFGMMPGSAYWYRNNGDLAFTWAVARSYPNLFGSSDQARPRVVDMETLGGRAVLAVEPAGEAGEKLELYMINFTDLTKVNLATGWQVVATDISVTGNKTIYLTDDNPESKTDEASSGSGRLYLVVRGDIDTDKDGLPDARERFVHGSNPLAADSDGDGLPDGWEAAHQFDLTRADANLDSDGDGFSNAEEFERKTDPRDAQSAKVTWYANSSVGNDAWTGRALSQDAQDGPFLRINKALEKAIKGDRVEVASGAYNEDVDISGRDINFVTIGNVVLQSSDRKD